MVKADKFHASTEEWDSRKLGQDEAFVKRARRAHEDQLEKALGLQMISVRLQKQLIEDLKFIATAHGIGYQPLMRDVLSRFVSHEKKQIILEVLERQALEAKQLANQAQDTKVPSKQRRAA